MFLTERIHVGIFALFEQVGNYNVGAIRLAAPQIRMRLSVVFAGVFHSVATRHIGVFGGGIVHLYLQYIFGVFIRSYGIVHNVEPNPHAAGNALRTRKTANNKAVVVTRTVVRAGAYIGVYKHVLALAFIV